MAICPRPPLQLAHARLPLLEGKYLNAPSSFAIAARHSSSVAIGNGSSPALSASSRSPRARRTVSITESLNIRPPSRKPVATKIVAGMPHLRGMGSATVALSA
jgi:hypothetical protein